MKQSYSFLLITILSSFSNLLFSQTYQLTGNPVNTTGWTMVAPTSVNTDFIQLTQDINHQSGSIRLNQPINLKYCDKWRIEFDFRMDSNQNSNGDGIAFWYLANPPSASVLGSGLGVSLNAIGFVVGFDTYNNTTTAVMSKVHVGYGQIVNTTDTNNVEFFNVPGSSFHSPDMNTTLPFQGTAYKHVEVTAQVDPAAPANWIVKITINGNLICNQSFAPSGTAAAMTVGYFGFSASTGGNRSRHSIKNVKVYVDKIPLLQGAITKNICPDVTGMATVDLTSLNSQLTTNPNNYTFAYYTGGSPITNPTNFQYSADTNVSVVIKDPSQVLCDNNDATITLKVAPTNGRAAGTYAWVDASSPYSGAGVNTVQLITPFISLAGLTSPYISFEWFKNHSTSTSTTVSPSTYDNNKLTVEVNSGSGWVSLWSDTSNSNQWRPVGIPLPSSYIGTTIQVRFTVDKNVNGNGYFYDDVLLDNVEVKQNPVLATGEVSAAKNTVKVYPNPFKDTVSISDIEKVKSVSISDVSGRMIKTIENPSKEINVSTLNSGLYLLIIRMKDGSQYTVKAIKN